MGFTCFPIKCPARRPARMGKIYLYYKGGKDITSRRQSRMGSMKFTIWESTCGLVRLEAGHT